MSKRAILALSVLSILGIGVTVVSATGNITYGDMIATFNTYMCASWVVDEISVPTAAVVEGLNRYIWPYVDLWGPWIVNHEDAFGFWIGHNFNIENLQLAKWYHENLGANYYLTGPDGGDKILLESMTSQLKRTLAWNLTPGDDPHVGWFFNVGVLYKPASFPIGEYHLVHYVTLMGIELPQNDPNIPWWYFFEITIIIV